MKLLEFARGSVFWILDALKGGKVKSALTTLHNCEDGIWSEEKIKEYQMEQVQRLLTHAKSTVPFYRYQTSTDLRDWPVVNKNVLRSSGDAVLSSQYTKDSLIAMSTSGSTGTPFTCWQNVDKKKHVNAETLYYNGKTGFAIGRRIIYLRSVVAETQKSAFQQFSQNIYLLDCTDLSDKGIEEKLEYIRKHTSHCGAMMMGYSSTLDAFRKYFEKNGYDNAKGCNLYGIVGGSPMLYDETRAAMEKAFGCRCYSRYANEENGFLGQDDKENNVFLMNRADYFTEVLMLDSDEPAQLGEIGRIVITDLWNYAMPMIRYDTGDVGAWVRYQGTERLAIGNFGGRSVDMIFNAAGETVSPHSISTAMWAYKNVQQYQFAQIGKGQYEMRLNAVSAVNEEQLIADLKKVVGEEATIALKYYDEIPVLASGKRRYIVNEVGIVI